MSKCTDSLSHDAAMPFGQIMTETVQVNSISSAKSVTLDLPPQPLWEESLGALKHPLGVKPGGNALTSKINLRESMGIFVSLPEEILNILMEWLDTHGLNNLAKTCRAFYAYATSDHLWRDLAINENALAFSWRGSWRSSHLHLFTSQLSKIDCSHLFSDALHRPFLCSQLSLPPFAFTIPRNNAIVRVADLSPSDFEEFWVNKPFILTDPVKQWPLQSKWSQNSLLESFGDTIFRAEAVDWPLRTYVDYMNSTNDESPLYLFDRGFVEKMKLEVGREGEYWPPECFGQDLFSLLGEHRPDHRWLIIGPERSGSTFHKDPNATSAWNAVIRGSKYWIMFPSSIIPPGVFMSEDQSEVTSPLSIGEWLLTFHEEARQTAGCIEGFCREGEVLHVPSGWWHLVVNLEPAIAITQNFVPVSHLAAAITFLKDKPEQTSGFKDEITDPHGLFIARLKASDPDLLAKLEQNHGKKRKWADVVGDSHEQSPGAAQFSFGFGSDLENDEEL